MNAPWGHNTRLSPVEVKRAVLERLQHVAVTKGRDVPGDIVEFMDKADLILLDDNNQPVKFARAIVTWED